MSHKAISWSGVFPAVTTQFRNDFSLDLDATHTVIKNLVRDGVSGLVVCGTVGENTSMTVQEKLAVIEVARDAADGKVPVIAGIAEFTTAFAQNMAREAQKELPRTSAASPARPICRSWSTTILPFTKMTSRPTS